MLNHHRLVSRRGPEYRDCKPRVCRECAQEITLQYFRSLNWRDRFDIVISGSQKYRPQAEKVARYLEINNLSGTIAENFIGADPTLRKDVRGSVLLALMDKVDACHKISAATVQAVEDFPFCVS
ncbi:hypothetical protein [Hyphomonas sp.]|jgi:hypothetical protein|uniref:hypothetical protein n=1 Tax=Hyphomonas sp. TaxID=87 RepID=UPI0030F73D3E